ncbi:MAG: hypothetical protein MZU91_06570 [Desulfosudis oleivorans]|nr:hypothetical protein [Desulfosudis oleivorans]
MALAAAVLLTLLFMRMLIAKDRILHCRDESLRLHELGHYGVQYATRSGLRPEAWAFWLGVPCWQTRLGQGAGGGGDLPRSARRPSNSIDQPGLARTCSVRC